MAEIAKNPHKVKKPNKFANFYQERTFTIKF